MRRPWHLGNGNDEFYTDEMARRVLNRRGSVSRGARLVEAVDQIERYQKLSLRTKGYVGHQRSS